MLRQVLQMGAPGLLTYTWLGLLALALRLWPRSRLVEGVREVLPFLTCILIYTNLHDTIGFVNPHDVHHWLVALDAMIFGVQPCVWAERFITPARTEAGRLRTAKAARMMYGVPTRVSGEPMA